MCTNDWCQFVANRLPYGKLITLPGIAHTANYRLDIQLDQLFICYSAPIIVARIAIHFFLHGIVPGPQSALNIPLEYRLDKIPYIAAFDSSSAMLRAISCWLQMEEFPNLGKHAQNDTVAKFFAKQVNRLPNFLMEKVFSLSGSYVLV